MGSWQMCVERIGVPLEITAALLGRVPGVVLSVSHLILPAAL